MVFQKVAANFKKKILSSQLRINMLSGVAATGTNVLLTIISYPVYLHYLGYEKYGVWLVLSTILTFTQLSNLGIGSAVMKLVAEEHGKDDTKAIQNYTTTAIAILTISGLIAFVIILLFKVPIIGLFKLGAGNSEVALLLLPYMGALSVYVFMVQVFNATLSGLGRMDLANYCDSLGRLIALIVSISLLSSGYGIESMFLGNILSYIFIHVSTLYLINHQVTLRIFTVSNLDYHSFKRLLHIGGGMFGSSLISMLLGPFNKLIISRYIGVSAIPLYEIAFNSAMQLRGLIESGFRAIAPEISRLSGNMNSGSISRITQINGKAVKIVWLFGAPFFAVLLLFISPALKLWLGARYVDTLPLLVQIMLAGTFFSLLGVPSFHILLGLGRTKQIFTGNVIQSCTNAAIVLAVYFLGFQLSVNIIAFSVATGMVIAHLYLVWQKRLVVKGYIV